MHKETGSNISNVYERLTNESASLIHIKLIMSTPLIASESMPWTMPLVSSASTNGIFAGGGSISKPIDRCFCRYVTQPTFGVVGSALAAESERRLLAPSANGGVALHLRTGLADMFDHEMRQAVKHKEEQSQQGGAKGNGVDGGGDGEDEASKYASTWLHAACSDSALKELPSALVLSDAPGLISRLLTTYPNLHAIDQRALVANATMKNSDGDAVVSSRSWGNTFEPKLGAAIDATAAGVASEVVVSRYSSMLKPAVARSMCTRKITSFGSREKKKEDAPPPPPPTLSRRLCPQFDTVFLRNLRILTNDRIKWACTRAALISHPCKEVQNMYTCRENFMQAMI